MHVSLKHAMDIHQLGCIDEAQLLYSKFLLEQPLNSDALHLLSTAVKNRAFPAF
jgi:hypothetical protein